MPDIISQLAWARLLGVFGVVHLIRAARPSFRPDAGKGLSGIWSSLVLLYLAVGLLGWGLLEIVMYNREEHRSLENSLLRLTEENSKLSERLRALESK
jgi:hypothetical protein